MRLSDDPCPLCLALAKASKIRVEAVQRLPVKPFAPLSRYHKGVYCCHDCAVAEAVRSMDFEAARVCVANDRQEQYRLPGAPMGLVRQGIMRPSAPGDLEAQHRWLDAKNWFDLEES